MKDRLLVIDGHNYLYRAYFGIPTAATLPSGIPVNAVFGFLAFLRRVINFVYPKHLIVVFDSEKGVEKKQLTNPNYKANRDYTDTGMFKQLPFIKNILSLAKVNYIESPDFEADDIIGSISNHYSKIDTESYISSNDFDFMQLIRSNLWVIREVKGKQLFFNENEVVKKFGIYPKQYLDYLVLKGDKSDNIVGVPGIGDKTAKELITIYKTLENIIANSNSLNKNLKCSVDEFSNTLIINKNLLKIDVDLEIHSILDNVSLDYDFKILQEKSVTLLNKIGVN